MDKTTIELMTLMISLFCEHEIDPRFDVKECKDYMSKCVMERGLEVDECTDYYTY